MEGPGAEKGKEEPGEDRTRRYSAPAPSALPGKGDTIKAWTDVLRGNAWLSSCSLLLKLGTPNYKLLSFPPLERTEGRGWAQTIPGPMTQSIASL